MERTFLGSGDKMQGADSYTIYDAMTIYDALEVRTHRGDIMFATNMLRVNIRPSRVQNKRADLIDVSWHYRFPAEDTLLWISPRKWKHQPRTAESTEWSR